MTTEHKQNRDMPRYGVATENGSDSLTESRFPKNAHRDLGHGRQNDHGVFDRLGLRRHVSYRSGARASKLEHRRKTIDLTCRSLVTSLVEATRPKVLIVADQPPFR